MTTQKKCSPALRFAGFTDDWEQRKLGETLEILPFKLFLKEPEQYGKYEIIQQGNEPIIGFANGTPCYDYKDTVIFGDHTLSLYKPKRPFFVATDGVRIIKGLKNIKGDYLLSMLEKYKPSNEGYKRYYSILSNIECSMTFNNEEQTQIGNFFKQLDETIALHKRKLKKQQNLKKFYLEKMFPKENSLFPEIRFPNFTDAWEQRKLGDIANIFDGIHHTPKYTTNGVMFLSVENISTLRSNKFISEEDFKKDFKIYPEINDVLMTRIGDVGTTNVVNTTKNIAYYVSLALLKLINANPYFISTAISSEKAQRDIWQRTLHIAFPKKINKNEIEKVEIYTPNLEEQTQIGNFFKQLDETIALHKRMIEKLEKIKQAYLKRMFI